MLFRARNSLSEVAEDIVRLLWVADENSMVDLVRYAHPSISLRKVIGRSGRKKNRSTTAQVARL